MKQSATFDELFTEMCKNANLSSAKPSRPPVDSDIDGINYMPATAERLQRSRSWSGFYRAIALSG